MGKYKKINYSENKYVYDENINEKTLWNWCIKNNRTEILDQIRPKTKMEDIAKKMTYGSNKKIEFECEYGHIYKKSIKTRIRTLSMCPKCSNGRNTSFPEQTIYFYVKKIFSDAINREKVEGEELDIYIPSIRCGIEYNGYRWHKELEDKSKKDRKKQLRLKKKGINILLINEVVGNSNKITKFKNSIRFTFKKIDRYKTGLDLVVIAVIEWLKKYSKDKILIPEILIEKDIQDIFSSYSTYCGKEKSIANSKEKEIKEKLKYWDYEKNKIKTDMVTKQSGIKVWWKCEICGKSFTKSIKDVIGKSIKNVCCKECGKKLWSGKSKEIINLTTGKVYESITKASLEYNNKIYSCIHQACIYGIPRYGCLWMYLDEYEKLSESEKKKLKDKAKETERFAKHRVRIKDLQTGIVYNSISEASRKTGNSIGAIQNSIRKNKPNLSGKQWVLA